MISRIKPEVPTKSKAVKPYKPSPGHNPDPKFNYEGLVHRGPKPPPSHPNLKFRGEPSETQEWPVKAYKKGGVVKNGKKRII